MVFGGMNGGIYGVDARTGLTKWTVWTKGQTISTRHEPYIYSSPIISNDDIAFVGAADSLYAVELAWDGSSGSSMRRASPSGAPPALSADPQKTVYVGGIDTFVHAVDSETGTSKWEWETGGFPDDGTILMLIRVPPFIAETARIVASGRLTTDCTPSTVQQVK